MFGMGGGELIVLGLVALFVLGPERLPGAIRAVAAALNQGRAWLDSAKQQLDTPEFQQLREPLEELRGPLADLRSVDPRRAARDFLSSPTTKPTASSASEPARDTEVA